MKTETVKTARKMLKEKSIVWFNYQDLRKIEISTNDIEIKSACRRLQTFITQGV